MSDNIAHTLTAFEQGALTYEEALAAIQATVALPPAAAQPPTDVGDLTRVVRGLSAFQAVELAKWHDAEATRLLGELQRAHQRQMAELTNRYEAARTDWQNTGCPFCPRCGYPDPDTSAAAQPGERERALREIVVQATVEAIHETGDRAAQALIQQMATKIMQRFCGTPDHEGGNNVRE